MENSNKSSVLPPIMGVSPCKAPCAYPIHWEILTQSLHQTPGSSSSVPIGPSVCQMITMLRHCFQSIFVFPKMRPYSKKTLNPVTSLDFTTIRIMRTLVVCFDTGRTISTSSQKQIYCQ